MTIKKGKIGAQDIEFGTDTFDRTGKSGTPITLDKVNAGNLPIADAGSKFTDEYVEGALQECLVEDGEGSPAKSYVNKSGGIREAGDVVRIDTDNDEAFELTTTGGDTLVLGVVAEAIAVDASGRILSGGYATTVKVDAACARGSYLRTSTTTTKATPSASFEGGTFGIALSSTGGVGTVSAYIFSSGSGGFLPLGGGTMTGEILSAGRRVGYVSKSAAYTTEDTNEFIDVTAGGGGVTVTIHSTGIAKSGKRWFIRNADGGAGGVTIVTEGSETINGVASIAVGGQYNIVELYSDGTNLILKQSSGTIVQVQYASYNTYNSTTATIPYDDTIPQNDEGDELLTLAITPKYSDSKLLVEALVHLAGSGGGQQSAALFKDSVAGALSAINSTSTASWSPHPLPLTYEMTSGTISEIIFKLRWGTSTGIGYINGNDSFRVFGGVMISSLKITERTA